MGYLLHMNMWQVADISFRSQIINFRSKLFLSLLVLTLGCFWLPLMAQAQNTPAPGGPYTVAVLDFYTNRSGFRNADSTEVGQAIPAILTTELANSDRFSVIEREQLELVLKEQELGASGGVTAESAARMKQLLGVDYLITGKVTEFVVEHVRCG